MFKIKNIIDFEIIWKKLHNVISKDEEKLLDNWLTEKESHSQYYKNAEKFYANGSDFDENPADTDIAWNDVSKRIKNKKSLRLNYLYYAMAVASVFVIATLVFNWNKGDSPIAYNTKKVIEPGIKQAKLVLNDGSTYNLSEGEELLIQEAGVQIKSHGTTIEYTATNDNSTAIKYNTIEIPRGGEFLLKLSDGTKIWLNSETSLKYPLQFPKNHRNVALSGEAYFEVAKDKTAPFTVTSGKQTVTVLGTSFNISSYKEDSVIYTTLVEGKVSLSFEQKPEITTTLLPGDQGLMLKNNGAIDKRKVETDLYTAWKDGRFYFKDQTLVEIMKTLSRWYNVDIIFNNNNAKTTMFTGDLKRYDNIEEILSKIEKTNEVKFNISDRTITVN